ncbi:MAG TPA: hypothetical protein PLU72_11080 [Candidatus Ozemobacteraceae bacterium]|nr:hypothetical protein [Candidatus Ozemobacteraceae bacterium]
MNHSERLERRLRIVSFLFVVVAIVLVFGSFIMAAQSYSEMLNNATLKALPTADALGMLLTIVTTERFVNRLLFMALFVMQLGLLFMLYLLFTKLRRLISHEMGED